MKCKHVIRFRYSLKLTMKDWKYLLNYPQPVAATTIQSHTHHTFAYAVKRVNSALNSMGVLASRNNNIFLIHRRIGMSKFSAQQASHQGQRDALIEKSSLFIIQSNDGVFCKMHN